MTLVILLSRKTCDLLGYVMSKYSKKRECQCIVGRCFLCDRGAKVRMACRYVPNMVGAPEVHCISSILPPSTRTYFISFFTLPRHFTHFLLFDIMGESRMELVAWLNDLLQLNYRKVEQAGTGKHLFLSRYSTRSLIVVPCRCCLLSGYGFHLR